MNPFAKAAFSVAKVTLEVRAHNWHIRAEVTLDRSALGGTNQIQPDDIGLFRSDAAPLVDQVAEEIVCKETEILEGIISRMFEVMQRVAQFSCEYIKRERFGRQSIFCIWPMLMIAKRTKDGLIGSKEKAMIKKMARELTGDIEDFMRAWISQLALCLAKNSGKCTFFDRFSDSSFSVSSCRARAFTWAAQVCRGWLPP